MQKALLLAENINGFIKFVINCYQNRSSFIINRDKLYQVKLFIEEYKFQILADELHRINQFEWDRKYTHLLVDSFIKGFNVIEEYIKNNYNDLFMFTGKLYTLKNLSLAFSKDSF